MLILFIDDDLDDFNWFCEGVKAVNSTAHCLYARDGNDALRILDDLTVLPELILLDINMPGMDGRECLKRIKARPNLKDISVLMYSTSISKKQSEELLKLGAKECIIKPPTFSGLIEVLKRLSI